MVTHSVRGLTQSELLKMGDTKSGRAFKFGDGRVVHSTKKVKISAMIGQTRCQDELVVKLKLK